MVDANEMLVRMTHRGACGCEENTGDGAGILVAVPDGFLRKAAAEAGIGELPVAGQYAVGNIFVPKFENAVHEAKSIVERVCKQRGMNVGVFLFCFVLFCLLPCRRKLFAYWFREKATEKLGKCEATRGVNTVFFLRCTASFFLGGGGEVSVLGGVFGAGSPKVKKRANRSLRAKDVK